jgi:Raf kinase inhibitor-like YbhB/YbcL family protein
MAHGPDHEAGSPQHSGAALTIMRITPYQQGAVALVSPALDVDGWIDDRYSAWFDDLVPEVAWTPVLEAETYVLLVEDPDAPMARPFVHWVIWNIPGTAQGVPAGLSRVAHPPELPGAVQGLNSAGGHGWHGTKPPEGHGVHHYHFQLFALSGRLDHLKPGAELETLVDALKGMTIASGEIVGLYERRDPLATPPPPAEDARGGLDEDDADRHAPHTPDGEVLQRPPHSHP